MFTMVLRKYLIGGKILGIEQIDGDRLIKICIEASDELGFNSIYYLPNDRTTNKMGHEKNKTK